MVGVGEKDAEILERALQLRVKAGQRIEREEEMTPRYRDVLVQTMLIAADLELMTLPSYYGALLSAHESRDVCTARAARRAGGRYGCSSTTTFSSTGSPSTTTAR